MIEVFPVLCQAAAAVEPCERSFDDPPPWKYHETFGAIGALDDLDLDLSEDFLQPIAKLLSLIAAIGVELEKEWKQSEQCSH